MLSNVADNRILKSTETHEMVKVSKTADCNFYYYDASVEFEKNRKKKQEKRRLKIPRYKRLIIKTDYMNCHPDPLGCVTGS